MKKISSQPVIKKLKKIFGNRFKVTTETQNKICFDDASYNPDLVFWSKDDNSIKAVIEVEQGTRKHTVGGVITADYCMGKMQQRPLMVIIALTEQDRKDYLKRKRMLSYYVKHLKDIVIGNTKEIIAELNKLE